MKALAFVCMLALASCGAPRAALAPASPAKTAEIPKVEPRAVTPKDEAGAKTFAVVSEHEASGLIDVAAAEPPSPALPQGSLYLGVVCDGAQVIEWDPSGARVLRSVTLHAADFVPTAVRVVATKTRTFATVARLGEETTLHAFDRALHPVASARLPGRSLVSLTADDAWVAVSGASGDPEHDLTVTVFDAQTLAKRGEKILGGAESMSAVPRSVELLGGRLYVAAFPRLTSKPSRNPSTGSVALPLTSVFALSLPSLATVARYDSEASSHFHSRLVVRDDRLFFIAGYAAVELTPDLRVVRERATSTPVVALGPKDQVAAPMAELAIDGERRSTRDELEEGEECVAAWPNDTPLLACTSSRGVRLYRM